MKKSELLNKIADIQTTLEDQILDAKKHLEDLRELKDMFDSIPDEPDEIED